MKNKTLLVILGSICLALVFAALPFLAACPAPTTQPPTTQPPTTQPPTTTPPTTTAPPAEGPIVLKYGTCLPEPHPHSIADVNWMNKIEEETQGRVKFERYFGGTLVSGDEGYSELAEGVADVAWFSRIAKPAGYDLGVFMETAFMLVPPEYALPLMDELCQEFPQIMAEYTDVKLLVNPTILGEYQLQTVGKAVRRPEDLKGLTVNIPGSCYIDLVVVPGGSAVNMGPPDWYMALQKATIDGILLFPESQNSMKFSEVIDYITMVNFGDGPEMNRGMNWDTWNSLPADIQEVFERNIGYLTHQTVIQFERANEAGLETASAVGIEIIQLSPAELEEFYKIAVEIQDREAAKIDDMGLPGTDILKEVRRLSEEYAK
jgi:TRAP-type C4-dicarboxylate transport system substrate-binding protein